jgi:hypothetical protein
MAISKRQADFVHTEEGLQVKQELKAMLENSKYNTESSYSTNGELYHDNLRPFIDKHMDYLASHPSVDLNHYLSNLRLITRVR